MATIQLDKEAVLELLDGEEVIYSHPKVVRKDGFLKTTLFNLAITNKRIALVRYPKRDKAKKGTETINYADVFMAERGKDPTSSFSYFIFKMNEKRKMLGFIPVHVKQTYWVQAGAWESLTLMGKEFASGMKDIGMNMAQSMENNQIYLDSKTQGEYDERYKKMTAEWQSIRASVSTNEANTKSKPTPYDRRNLIVKLVNEACKLAGK